MYHYLTNANNCITPLQDAIDLDIATDAEKQKLIEWKKYRVLLNRVDCSAAPEIDCPKAPK
ncbi:phage tail protein [Photorhabdus luminescens]|nr:phage tail protein [Photorhabdus luminescens]